MQSGRWMSQQELTKMGMLRFSQTLEQHIQDEIEDAYPLEWDEDYITLRICKVLRRMSYAQVELQNNFSNVLIAAFKLKGKEERKFGDIGIVLDLQFKDRDRIYGVAFLEAKKRYENSNEYTALDFDQLQRIYQYAPSSRLLLYNYHPMSSLAPTGLDSKSGATGLLPKIPVTHTSLVPVILPFI